MPKIEGELVLPGDEAIEEGKTYKILEVQEFTSQLQGFAGYRVILDAGKNDKLSIPLWKRSQIGRKSKLGAFVSVLGSNTDDWIDKTVRFITWQPRRRQIELVK